MSSWSASFGRRVTSASWSVGCFDHELETVSVPHRRVFAQFADRTQLDLVVFDTAPRDVAGAVVLYDPEGCIVPRANDVDTTSPDMVRTWCCLGWEALADLGKYVRRESPWEARARLEEARVQLWRLLAVDENVVDPQYEVTSVLDADPRIGLPPGIDATVASLDLGETLAAGRRVGELLLDVQRRLAGGGASDAPEALGRFMTEDLARLQAS